MHLRKDRQEYFTRYILQLYTRMPRIRLIEYVGGLELLAKDRQATFFKMDLYIEAMKEDNIKGWHVFVLHN